MFRINLRHWLHAAFPGPSEVPWQWFSWFYWYQKRCQGGFHGPNVREMAQNMITHITDRLQQLPLWGANWYPMVWKQDSHGQLLLSPIPNHTERMWKLPQDVPGCSRDKHEGNPLADIVTQLWTLEPHLHLAQKATTFPSPRFNIWLSNSKHLCKEFLQSALWAMWSPFSSISQTTLTTNISCHTFLLTWNASKTISLFLVFFQQQKTAPIWEGLSASLHCSLWWCHNVRIQLSLC